MSTKTLKIPSTLHRSGSFVQQADGSMRLSISSDEPYERYDWMNDERYLEVLDHSEKGADLSRLRNGAALLYNHDRNILLGTLSEPCIENGRCYVNAKLSDAEDVRSYRTKINEGILKDTSIGYSIADEGVKIGKRESDGLPIYKFRFSVHEASLVTIPADTTVGVGRQRDTEITDFKEISVECKNPIDNKTNKDQKQKASNSRTTIMADETAPNQPTIDVVRVERDAVAQERKRVADIQELNQHFMAKGIAGRRVDASRQAEEMIRNGKTAAEFQDLVIRTELPEVKPITTEPTIGMSKRDLSSYSLVRAMNCLAGRRPLDGLEKECSDEAAKLLRAETQGFFIPHDVMSHRALSTNVFNAAGSFVTTGPQGQSLIELYRNKMYVVEMGARVISGLQGNLAIPSQTGGATAYWLSESGTITSTDQTVGQVSLTPHRLGAETAFTYQLLAQASPDVENFVREDLMKVLAIEKDRAALKGSGVNGEPLGIYGTANKSTSVTLAGANSMIYANAVQFETNVATNNADVGTLGYLTSVATRGNAKLVAEIAAANSIPVWKNDMVNGYKARATNQLTTLPSVIFGNWSDLVIGDWNGTEVIVDPYTKASQGQVRIVMQQLTDVAIRHPKSFSISTT